MGHPRLENRTPFAVGLWFLADADGRPLFVPIIKATYAIGDGATEPKLAEQQLPVLGEGEPYGDPATSSYKYEPETAFVKPGTDVILIGHAWAPDASATQVDVNLRVGPIEKTVRVFGDRVWRRSLATTAMSRPKPFEKIPLRWEHAFGGWDRTDPDPKKHSFEPRNPVGLGFRSGWSSYQDDLPVANLEDPAQPLKSMVDKPRPAGFGFVSPHWQPRASLAGTYDDAWDRDRSPLLPTDFDFRFFNAAPSDQIAGEYLRGDEPVQVSHVTPSGNLSFSLPAVQPPEIRTQLRDGPDHLIKTQLDTVIVNSDDGLLILLWRANLPLRNGPSDIVALEATAIGASPVAQEI